MIPIKEHVVSVTSAIRCLGTFSRGLLLASVLPLIGGCEAMVSHAIGPPRAITIDEDVTSLRQLALVNGQDVQDFYKYPPGAQASYRNQIITARMYLIDVEYSRYEAQLTQELQNEGLLATATSLGLTTSATLVPVEQTSRLLSGIATGVTGLDKAYSEKELLSNTIQALQTQMRADRKAEAAAIYTKMTTSGGAPTSIDQYTLPMALSDTDQYYQAGTISSALIGLSKTVANANQNAEAAKDAAGPNGSQVVSVKAIATPLPPMTGVLGPPAPLKSSGQKVATYRPVSNPIPDALTPTESKAIAQSQVPAILRALCVSPATNGFGPLNSSARIALADFKAGARGDAAPPQLSDISQADQTIANLHDLEKLREAERLVTPAAQASRCAGPNPAFALGQQVK